MSNTVTHANHWHVGSVRITRVEESIVPVPWPMLVPGAEDRVEDCRPWIDPYVSGSGGRLLLSMHSFIVETPETVIVVDTCVGDSGEYKLPGDSTFGDRLAAALPGGIDAVDVVVCTHLHFDHVGWNTVEANGHMEPRFANARYLVTQVELDATRDHEDTIAYNRSIAPLIDAGSLDAVEPDRRIDPWVCLEPSPGHTPGHVAVRISDGEHTGVITGDLVHTPLQFAHPELASTPDHDPATATATRQRYVDSLANTSTILFGTHFAPPSAGWLKQGDDGVRFEQRHTP